MSFLGIDLDNPVRNFGIWGWPAQGNPVLKADQLVLSRNGAGVPIATHLAAQCGPRQRCVLQEWQYDALQGSRFPGHDRRGMPHEVRRLIAFACW